MAKSNLLLLQEAIEAGNLELAKQLTAKIASKAPRKPAKASKVNKRTKIAPSTTRPPKAKQDVSTEVDESLYIHKPTRKLEDGYAGKTFVGSDGKQHKYGRRVEVDGSKFVNKFVPTGFTELTEKEKKLETQIKKIKPTPRPGQPGSTRDVAQKIKVQCSICNDWVEVYPWEIRRVPGDEEINFRCSKKRCTIRG